MPTSSCSSTSATCRAGVFTDNLFGTGPQPIKERDILRVEGPMGTFFLREDNPRPIILLASGTGFAPIKAIAEHIFAEGINREDSGKVVPPGGALLGRALAAGSVRR